MGIWFNCDGVRPWHFTTYLGLTLAKMRIRTDIGAAARFYLVRSGAARRWKVGPFGPVLARLARWIERFPVLFAPVTPSRSFLCRFPLISV